MLKSIKKMLEELNSNNIEYCHWKSNEHLIESLNGDTDLDILFNYEQKEKLESILCNCGLKRFRATPLMQYNAIEDFIGFDKETAKIWHLHTHYRMTIGEKHLKGYTVNKWNRYVLESRIKIDNIIYTSSPEVELVLLYCRMALKIRFRDIFKKIGEDDLKEIKWLNDRIDITKLQNTAIEMTNQDISKELCRINNKITRKNELIKLQKQIRKHLKSFTGYGRISSYLVRTKRELFWLFGGIMRRLGCSNYNASRRVSPSGGTVVAVIGCDGAGKSTTLSYVVKEFNKKIDTVSIYFGSGDGQSSLIRTPMRLIAKKVGGKGIGHSIDKEYKESKKKSLKTRLYMFAKLLWAVTLAKEKEKKLKKMIKARNNGLLVVTDRFPQNEITGLGDGPLLAKYVKHKGLFSIISKWEKNKYDLASINKPDLTIKLIVPTDVAISRKPEMTKDEIEKKTELVKSLKLSSKERIINTDCDMRQSVSKVMDEIWKII